jgi:site-specific recombinase XerD
MRTGRKIDESHLPLILQEYATYRKSQPVSPCTLETNLYELMHLNEYVTQKRLKPLEQIGRVDIELFMQELAARVDKTDITKISQAYVKQVAAAIRTFLKWLTTRKKIFDANEFCIVDEDLKAVKRGNEEDNREALCEEDEKQIFRNLTDVLLRMLVWTGRNFGLRRMEYCNLRLRHLELDKKELDKKVPAIKIEKSKGGKTRRIPMFPEQVIQWKTWLKYRNSLNLPHDFVFYNPKKSWMGITKHALSYLFHKIAGFTKVILYSHRLRYTYAVNLWEGGVDIYTISRALGHSKVETTIRYLKVPERDFVRKFMESARGCFH